MTTPVFFMLWSLASLVIWFMWLWIMSHAEQFAEEPPKVFLSVTGAAYFSGWIIPSGVLWFLYWVAPIITAWMEGGPQ